MDSKCKQVSSGKYVCNMCVYMCVCVCVCVCVFYMILFFL
jgi:hypothetical protein